MSYTFYKLLHYTGMFMVFSALGAQCLHAINGGTKDHKGRKWLGVMHGVGLLAVLVAGFGLIARLQLHSFPAWIYGKLAIWIALGGIGAIAARKNHIAGMIWVLAILLGFSAAYLANVKPG